MPPRLDVLPADVHHAYAWFAHVSAFDRRAMQTLLQQGLSVDVRHPLRHTTALMEAALRGEAEWVDWLLAQGACPVLLCGMPQGTPLHCAIRRHQWHIVRRLLNATEDATPRDHYGRTALHLLAMEIPHGNADPALRSLAEALIAKHCPLEARDEEGLTALHHATLSGSRMMVECLLHHGANPNAAVPDTGVTPLTMAALDRNRPLATLLLAHGANPHFPTYDGTTPLTLLPTLQRRG